jgi:hypothetical protein
VPDLLAGSVVLAADHPPTVTANDTTTISNISDATYVPGTPVVATTFVAATTGRALITINANIRNNAANTDRLSVSWQLNLGTDATGTLITDASAFRAVVGDGIASAGDYCSYGRPFLQTGLTPEATYYVRAVYLRFGANATCDIAGRELIVAPAT